MACGELSVPMRGLVVGLLLVSPIFAFSANQDDNFLRSLRDRVEQSKTLPLVCRETLLPRQRLGITIKNGLILDLVRQRLRHETPTFGMLGVQQSGEPMPCGVEVEILSYAMNQWKTGIRLELKAGKRFQLTDHMSESPNGWYHAPVKYLDSEVQEAQERHTTLAEARAMAKQFTDPDNHLIDKWLELARDQERFPGQIDALLEDLGEIPEHPSERAFWVGALINPTPKIHLAFEIRQRLLLAKTAKDRVQIASDALKFSIRRMDPSLSQFSASSGLHAD